MISIDLNADLGEGDSLDDSLLQVVSSCNIACGGHAGDMDSMAETLRLALRHGVVAGAHPSYPDRSGFGRRNHFMQGSALYESLSEQVTNLADIAADLGTRIAHLKPHGALYNDAADDAELADLVASVTADMPGNTRLVGLPQSELQAAAERQGLDFIAEAFIDRAYGRNGRLVSRSQPGAVHRDIETTMAQALSLATDRTVRAIDGSVISVRADTLCIHGDTPGADRTARAVREALEQRGVDVRCVGR